MAINNTYKAGLTLAGAAAGFVLSYPFQATFWGGLIHSGFSAAMVGGLADWYAVTALFRKPLSIPYRTAIIPKNRDRLFNAIVTMVEEEIVTAANIKETLEKAGLARLILGCVNSSDSRRRLSLFIKDLAREANYTVDAGKLAAALESLLAERQSHIRLAPLAGQALEWSLNKGFADKMTELVIREIKQLTAEPELTQLIAGIYNQALQAYAVRNNQRKLVGWLLENLLNLDPMAVASLIQDKLTGLLDEVESGQEHPLRLALREWLTEFAGNLQQNSVLAEQAETVLRPLLVKLAEHLVKMPATHPELTVGGITWAVKQTAKLADEAVADPQKTAWFDRYLAVWLARWVSQNHGQIGQIVRTYLESFSNEELVVYIEDKVLNDLQMIRINGSIVGGLVGMLLFLIAYSAGVRI